MKYLTYTFILSLFCTSLQAQNEAAAVNFIRSVFHQTGIVYTDRVKSEIIDSIRKSLQRDTVYSFFGREDTLIIKRNMCL